MILKHREESLELKIMRSLFARMELSAEDEKYYVNLEKGYEGEVKFDERMNGKIDGKLVLNDLLLEQHNTLFQIDSLIISSKTIYLFEVKNFDGDFYVEGDRWYTRGESEIKNPLLQLQRNESLLRRLLQDMRCNIPVEACLVFMNPEFHLYQAPLKRRIIFPPQLNRFFDDFKKKPSRLKAAHSHLADRLLALHLTDTPNFRLPDYQYEQLKKGIYCPKCFGLYEQTTRLYFFCANCGEKEHYETGVLRAIDEFKHLFPGQRITTNRIFEWCSMTKDKRSLRRILLKNYTKIGQGKSSTFV